jgi:hypothetical protein
VCCGNDLIRQASAKLTDIGINRVRVVRTGTHDVTPEHVLDAPPAAVFDTYVDPVADRIIFAGGPDWTVEVRLGVLWTIATAACGGPACHETNCFTAIDRPGHRAVEPTLTMPDGANGRCRHPLGTAQ